MKINDERDFWKMGRAEIPTPPLERTPFDTEEVLEAFERFMDFDRRLTCNLRRRFLRGQLKYAKNRKNRL